jgi:release factor glutamine methyltransferase
LVSLPAEAAFDFIVSNPPYVSDREYAELPRDVREFEPRMALLSGPQGTEVIARLVPQAAVRLAPGGSLMIEISPMIATAVEAIFQAEPRLEGVEIHKDLARKPRVVTAKAR